MESFLETAVDWVIATVGAWGYIGIFAMMFVESSFVPFPSEVALIPAGYLASRGEMDPVLAVLAGVCGSLGGAAFNYSLAHRLGRPVLERIGRYFLIGPAQFERADRYFAEHGEITTFVGRLIPAVRQLISIPAGLARMHLGRFVLYTALGSGLWSTVLVVIGYLAGESEALWRPLLRNATVWLVGGGLLLVAIYVHRHRRAARTG
ncbi:MAG: DedA family protein [Myxococcota bacterium]